MTDCWDAHLLDAQYPEVRNYRLGFVRFFSMLYMFLVIAREKLPLVLMVAKVGY
ncbi:hypothetical protein COCSADRAFT_35988 [Bipolaris sorokiniana ND90Pr]|uniref:Uncharacterized protein n=1 Tax=Cochliobolus sativus (strain ND90Pr / ATCC 201652) TaxID=665912 RepID=M2SBE9_COCSN|nr:uncharacterized protein COCSADRAFT_35988 [Bipolaris sorokiniana ND90Pr]EMD64603.1 hypothetical protein COCSADRAFT_35988 [Bipolaris sorokiniana ND90Pr]